MESCVPREFLVPKIGDKNKPLDRTSERKTGVAASLGKEGISHSSYIPRVIFRPEKKSWRCRSSRSFLYASENRKEKVLYS